MILGYDFIEERLYSDLLEEEKLFAWAQLAKKAGLNEAEKRAVGAVRRGASSDLRKWRYDKSNRSIDSLASDVKRDLEMFKGISALRGENPLVALGMAKGLGESKVPKNVTKRLSKSFPSNSSKNYIEELMGKPLDKITREDVVLFKDNLASGLKKIGSM